jgi:hypothetical protein
VESELEEEYEEVEDRRGRHWYSQTHKVKEKERLVKRGGGGGGRDP